MPSWSLCSIALSQRAGRVAVLRWAPRLRDTTRGADEPTHDAVETADLLGRSAQP